MKTPIYTKTCFWAWEYRRRHETDAQRSSPLADYKYHLLHSFESSQTPNMGEKAHTQTMQIVRVGTHCHRPRCRRRRCELFCPYKFVPLVALSSQHACCTVGATHSLELSSLAFVLCACAPVVYVQIRSAGWNVNATIFLFFLLILNCHRTAMLLSFYMKNKHKRKELCEYVIISHIIVIRRHRCRSPSRCCCFCEHCRLTQVHSTMNALFVAFRL